MINKTRTILFLSLLILFLIVAPLTVFYSLGWRFDWETRKITQPGIFYFKVQPKNVQVYLNGQLKKKTDFFFDSAFIENLFPKKYEIEIKKDGFYTWKKTLEIKQRQVTEAKNIVLISKEPFFEIISKQIEDLPSFLKKSEIFSEENEEKIENKIKRLEQSDLNNLSKNFKEISQSYKKIKFSPDFRKLAYFNDYEIYILFLDKKYDQPQKEAGDKLFLTRFSKKISQVFWFTNHYLIFNIGDKIKIIEIDDRDEINIVTLSKNFKNPEMFWDGKNKKLYILSNKVLYISEKLIP